MSPRLLRIDPNRIDALVFRAESVRFEACATFHGGADAELCECGWLEIDHETTVVSRRRFPRRRLQPAAAPAAARAAS
jgi:hypothetical protein